jgi:uncharacterized membrane protein YvlD (DUF360 family)
MWQSSPVSFVKRGVVVWLITAGALLLLSEILPGFTLDGWRPALGLAAVIGILNALLWPLVARVALPLTVLTLGLAALVLNGAVVAVAVSVIPEATIDGWPEGIVVTLGLTALTAIAFSLFAIDDDDSWARNVTARRLRKERAAQPEQAPGVVFLEIDGLAWDIVRRALRDGTMPNLARWVHDGSYRLERWETDLSSQTGACQAGILHGSNHDMPAFRWWEKDTGKPIVTNHPRDAAELERRHSNGRGLLHSDGASRANILSGDAPHSMLTMSTVLTRRRPIGRDYAAYFKQPYGAARTMVMSIAEFWRERRAAGRQRRRDVRPRIHRSRTYALMRAFATVIQLDLQVASVIDDVFNSRPVIYTTFLAYDEVAHHSGIERDDTLAVLAKVDRQLGRVRAAADLASRDYRLVVLSDHGQSQGATFLQRYGTSLEDVVSAACESPDTHSDASREDDAVSYLSAGLTELSRDDTTTARAVRRATGAEAGEVVELGDSDEERSEPDDGDGLPEVSVMASGCLGLVSLPREPGRVTLERLTELYPRLVPALREHPGIGFVLVRSAQHGAVALGRDGANYLDRGEVEGMDPLAPFGPNTAGHLRRTDSFPHCPDLVVNSEYWPETDEVAAFEELVGSHGGVGGPQSHPFACFPAELGWPDDPVVGAERIHRVFRGWLADLGHASYAEPGPGR